VLGASDLPDTTDATTVSAPNSIAPVNMFRNIFARYPGGNLLFLPDQLFYLDKADQQGYPPESNNRFSDVTARLAKSSREVLS
jgi:hypothetical protein